MSSWLLFSISTAVLWGLYATFLKRSYSSSTAINGAIYGAVIAFILLLPFALLKGGQLFVPLVVLVATLAAGSYISIYYAFEKGNASLIAPIQSTYPLTTIVLSAIFLGESTSLLAKLALIPIFVGLFLMSSEKPANFLKAGFGTWIWWGLGASILGGFGDFLGKLMVINYDPYTYITSFVWGWIIATAAIGAFDRKRVKIQFNKDSLFLLFSNIFLFSGFILFYLAFETGLASIVTPITGAYGIVTLLLALVWLKEKISVSQLVGALITISGVVLISRG